MAIAATNEGSAAGLTGKLTVQFADDESLVIGFDQSWKTADREMANWNPAVSMTAHGRRPWCSGRWAWRRGASFGGPTACPSYNLAAVALLAEGVHRRQAHPPGHALRHGVGVLRTAPERHRGWARTISLRVGTEFRKRVYYQTYDVTSMLRQGDNAHRRDSVRRLVLGIHLGWP